MMQEENMCEGILKVRHNVTEVSSIREFWDVRGGFDGNCKDVCFVRMTGQNDGYLGEVEQMDRQLSQQAAGGALRYQRILELPRLAVSQDVNDYSGCFDNWTGSGKKVLKLKVSEQSEQLQAILGKACNEALSLFGRVTPHASSSMEKNFAVKLMFWTDQVCGDLLSGFRPGMDMKFVMPGATRKQEYLFVCFLTFLGVDVLLLQHQSDLEDPVLEGLHLSTKVTLGDFGPCSLPAYQPYVPAPSVPAHTERRDNRARERRPLEVRKAREPGQSAGSSLPGTTAGSRADAVPARSTQRPVQGIARTGSAGRRELDFEELARLASSVVMISVHDRKGEVLGNGSGIMIGEEGYILTNHHVATGGRFYSVRIEDDNTIYKTDEIIKYNSVLDLAVIRIDRRLRPLPIYRGAKPLVRGQKVVAIGSPLGLFNSVSDGIISGFRVINDVDMIQFTAPISHGSSGGAVLNMCGEVIGISTAGFDNGQNINLAVGYEFISQFVSGFTGQHGK